MDAKFADASTDGFCISEIPELNTRKPFGDTPLRHSITQRIEPLREFSRANELEQFCILWATFGQA